MKRKMNLICGHIWAANAVGLFGLYFPMGIKYSLYAGAFGALIALYFWNKAQG